MLVAKMKDILVDECITKIPEDDTTRAALVEIRKSDESPSRARVTLTIRNFDPMNPKGWANETFGNKQMKNSLGFNLPPGLIGGATFEQVRGTIEVNANLTRSKEDVDIANEIIQEVIARAKFALRKRRGELTGFTDDYGETVLAFVVAGDTEYDGGAKTANTTRDFIEWSAITYADPRKAR